MKICKTTTAKLKCTHEHILSDDWLIKLNYLKLRARTKTHTKARGKISEFVKFMQNRHDKNYWMVFLAKYPFISKKYANY